MPDPLRQPTPEELDAAEEIVDFTVSDTVADEFEELPDGAGEPVTGTAH